MKDESGRLWEQHTISFPQLISVMHYSYFCHMHTAAGTSFWESLLLSDYACPQLYTELANSTSSRGFAEGIQVQKQCSCAWDHTDHQSVWGGAEISPTGWKVMFRWVSTTGTQNIIILIKLYLPREAVSSAFYRPNTLQGHIATTLRGQTEVREGSVHLKNYTG